LPTLLLSPPSDELLSPGLQEVEMRMLHAAFLLALLTLGAVRTAALPMSDTVDAATFLLAFRAGQADQYKGKTVTGSGLDFNGASPRLVLTVGAESADKGAAPVTTWDQFLAAQNARTTLIIALDAPDFKRTSWPRRGQKPDEYTFSGVFNGKTMTASRPGSGPDSGPCETPPANQIRVSSGPTTYHCVPQLDSATALKR
jgi:hypothetical protein